MEVTPFYRFSIKEAERNNEVDYWRESYKSNCDCARTLERYLNQDDAGKDIDGILKEYGFDRVIFVVANTFRDKNEEKQISEDSKEWIKHMNPYIPYEDTNWQMVVESEPTALNNLVKEIRTIWEEMDLYTSDDCIEEIGKPLDYTGKVVVINPHVFKDEYRTKENQLFLARCGFGCKPDSLGRKVFGEFLCDGEETYYLRGELLGVIKEDRMPEWAIKRLEELNNQPTNDLEMKGN